MMNDKFEAFRKAMLSSSKKVKGFVEENTVVVAAVGALADCRWYLFDPVHQ